MWHITGEQLIALLLIPLKSHQPPSWGSELMLSAAILGRPVITFNMENQQKAFDVFSEKWLKNQQVQFVCVWRLMSVSCCMSITHTKLRDTYLCAQGCLEAQWRAVVRESKPLYPGNVVRKSKRTGESRRNVKEKNKTTGRQRRVVLFFLLIAVPSAEASRPGTAQSRQQGGGGLYTSVTSHGQAAPLASPAGNHGRTGETLFAACFTARDKEKIQDSRHLLSHQLQAWSIKYHRPAVYSTAGMQYIVP